MLRSLKQDEVISVDDFEAFSGGEERTYFLAASAGDGADVVASESGFSSGKWRRAEIAFECDVDHVARREIAFCAGHTNREQAAAVFAQNRDGASVHEDRAGGTLKIGEPLFFRFHRPAARGEKG